jgi:hypothetical protein
VNGTAADDVFCMVSLSDGPVLPVTGDIFTLGFTAAITPVIGAWANGPVTFEQTLPVGRYQIVGCDLFDDAASFLKMFRLVPIGSPNRPGGATRTSRLTSNEPTLSQRMGRMGVWCEFDHLTPPTVEVVGGVAGGAADFAGVFDLIKVG